MHDQPRGPEELRTRHDLARALTVLRLHAGLSIRELASRLDVPTATVGDYFSGRHLPGPSRIPLLRRLLTECGVKDEAALRDWIEAVASLKRRAAPDLEKAAGP